MHNPTRDEARDFFFGVWAKHRAQEPLSALESMALAVILEHPEYHDVLGDPERHRDRTWTPEGGQVSPFLHLAMHLAIEEQISIDQPPGIREAVRSLASRLDSRMEAQHAVMECLAEQIWNAQRNRAPFSNDTYLECLRRKSGK